MGPLPVWIAAQSTCFVGGALWETDMLLYVTDAG